MQRMIGIILVLLIFAMIGYGMSVQANDIQAKSIWSEDIEAEQMARITEMVGPIEVEEVEEVELPSVTDLTGVKLHEQKVWDDIKLTEDEQIALWDKCKELEINYWFILALCESESSFRPDAVGDNGNSVGYMQINKCNWDRMAKEYGLDVHEPLDNLLCGAVIFAELANKYDTIERVVMSYKCGESKAKSLIADGFVLRCVEEITNRAIELQNAHQEVR